MAMPPCSCAFRLQHFYCCTVEGGAVANRAGEALGRATRAEQKDNAALAEFYKDFPNDREVRAGLDAARTLRCVPPHNRGSGCANWSLMSNLGDESCSQLGDRKPVADPTSALLVVALLISVPAIDRASDSPCTCALTRTTGHDGDLA